MAPHGTPVGSPALWACWELLTAACVKGDVIDRACFSLEAGSPPRCAVLLERLLVLEAAVVIVSDADGPTLEAFDCARPSAHLCISISRFQAAVSSRMTSGDSAAAWLKCHYDALTRPLFPLGGLAAWGRGGNVTTILRGLGTDIPAGVQVGAVCFEKLC